MILIWLWGGLTHCNWWLSHNPKNILMQIVHGGSAFAEGSLNRIDRIGFVCLDKQKYEVYALCGVCMV